jgi:putative peptidoglycan lipid II flippase
LADVGTPSRRAIAGAAALIAGLTVASRVAGFGRTVVFTWSVGQNDLGDIYLAANIVPNIIFEMVAGGALASLVVPLLAGAIAREDRESVAATASALLTWVLTLLVPLAVVVLLAAGPIIGLVAGDASPAQAAAGERMLRVFAPQLPLYGAGIVLTGVLQAHHRFTWPVVAPLLSSLTVVGTYLAYAGFEGRDTPVERVSRAGELLLAGGTTLGVVVLSGCLLVPLRRLGLRLRATYRLAGELRRSARSLALAGAVTVAAQQLALLVAVRLAVAGPAGTLVQYNLAQQVYLVPWAVLAVPLATAAFPVLANARATADPRRYADTLAGAARGVLLLTCLGAAGLVAIARPVARLFGDVAQVGALTWAVAGFAPGLLGYGLFALFSRALYARGDTGAVAGATVAGWAVAAAGAVAGAAALPDGRRALALALANSAGMLLLGVVLIVVIARRVGHRALAGTARAAAIGLGAAVVAAGAGLGAGRILGSVTGATPSGATAVPEGMLSGVVVCLVFLAVAYAGDRRDVRPMVAGLARRLRRPGSRAGPPGERPDGPGSSAWPGDGPGSSASPGERPGPPGEKEEMAT